jgi:hypothetical protein
MGLFMRSWWGDKLEKRKSNCNGGWGELYIPTHRDETAMDGAPELLCLVEENNGNVKKCT